MIPKIDSDIGISVYTTKYPGCGGKIKVRNDDFKVSEVLSQKTLDSVTQSEGFAIYKLKKSGIDTNHALETIFRKFGVHLKALGLKDSSAVTEQFVCSLGQNKSVPNYADGKISLEKIGFLKKPLSAKDMVGNKFVVTVTDPERDFADFAESDRIFNFYGYQRFGSRRPVTHLIGRALVQRRFDDAIALLLSFTSEYDSDENTKIRKIMSDPSNYSESLKVLPHKMDLERIALQEMIEHKDPQRAFQKLPLSIRRLFVDAYQSFIFNLTVCKAFEYGEELFLPQDGDVCYGKNANLGKYEMDPGQQLAIPLVGHSYFKKTRFDLHISKILQDEQINPKDFFFKEMQEISSEGGFRTASIHCTDFLIEKNTASFTLQRGSFATMVMREIMKPVDPLKAGF
ncbi:tRNA pseudouridine(13) synthase TruD [Candidatus Nitrosotenuis chungbukensis]|uniref:tRNA pseudouridine(13) synthase TruD n=1 Tax=Candidatus Nitrosotenuis chungbukensis TaxID=1353246 RepID=UPI0005B2A008|nr:tRNA pseudouridine(13) synthase TruD [Candidatus Nitrosotenuis chungbukensis]